MKAINEIKRIAEEVLLCQFFHGTLNELNQDIDNKIISKEKWIFGYVSPEQLDDDIQEGLIHTTLPFTAYIVKKITDETIGQRTSDVQNITDEALRLGRKFVYQMNNSDLVSDPSTKIKYPTIYGQFDAHTFGVGITCDFVICEGITGC